LRVRPLIYGFITAALAGAFAALLTHELRSENQREDYVATITKMVLSSDQKIRRDGWENIDESWSEDEISQLENKLIKSPKEIILDAALAFAQRGIDPQKNIHLYAESLAPDLYDPLQSLVWFEDSDASPLEEWQPTLSILLRSNEPPIRTTALSRAVRQCPEEDRKKLEVFTEHIPIQDQRNQAILQCVLGLQGSKLPESTSPLSATRNLLANTTTKTASTANTLSNVPPSLLHLASPEEADIELKRRAKQDDSVAKKILRSNDSRQLSRTAIKILEDKTKDIEIRRIAAWHIDQLDDGTAMGILSANPADGDNTVYATALLAEKHLSKSALDSLILRWLTDYEVNRRRAAALLIALRGDDPSVLLEAEQREHDPSARRTMRMALRALNAWPLEDVDSEVYAARTRTLKNGRFDPDTALLRILGQDPNALDILARQPQLPDSNLSDSDRINWRREMQWRDWILQRMVPQWHKWVGEPFGGDDDGLRMRLDLLEAIQLLQSDRLQWDNQDRRWQVVAKGRSAKDHSDNE